jgi:DNA-binding NarL/FixJ family response regulator
MHPQQSTDDSWPGAGARRDARGAAAVRVLIVEDDSLLRSALARALESDAVEVVASCATAADAMTIAHEHGIDVLVTDLDLGARPNGIELAHALRRDDPDLAVVVLTSYADPRLVGTKAAQLPVGTEYVVKQSVSDLDAIGQAIARAVARTAGPVPATGTPPGAPVALTDVQLETLRLVAAGYTNEQIAAERVVTQKSVEVTIARLSRRLGIPAGRAANQRVLLTRAHYQLSGQLPRAGDSPA